ncbi:MAG: FecR family protein [Bacteroidales bacterium]|jgi:ferric-dicitrate binding protein FerR (iron transport regulator)|nr:FecR family protein [Bacteroidales bacterium]
MNDKIDNILAKYFSGEADKHELHEMENWLAESEENEKYFTEMTILFQKTSPKQQSSFNTEKALPNFKKYIYQDIPILQAKKKDRFRIRYWTAAAIFLLITVSILFITNKKNNYLIIAADNQNKEITFSENINIVLNQHSTIEYKKDNLNEVKMTGEVTFNINSPDNQNFIVYAGKTIIKDIGTIFTVTANNDNLVRVEVQEGEVLFFTEENTGISIKENETGIYYELNNVFELITPLESPKVPDIVFNSQPLIDVVVYLQKTFGVEIIIDDKSLDNLLLTVHFEHNESLDLILNVIAETLSVKIINIGNAYKITK